MDDSVVTTVKNAHKFGEEKFCLFVKERFIAHNKRLTDPLKKNNLPTFVTLHRKTGKKVMTRARVRWHGTLSMTFDTDMCK